MHGTHSKNVQQMKNTARVYRSQVTNQNQNQNQNSIMKFGRQTNDTDWLGNTEPNQNWVRRKNGGERENERKIKKKKIQNIVQSRIESNSNHNCI